MLPRVYPDTIETAVQTGVHDHAYAKGRASARGKCFRTLCPKRYALTLCVAAALGGLLGTGAVKLSAYFGVEAKSPMVLANQIVPDVAPELDGNVSAGKPSNEEGLDPVADAVARAEGLAPRKKSSGPEGSSLAQTNDVRPDTVTLISLKAKLHDPFPGMAMETARVLDQAKEAEKPQVAEPKPVLPPLPSGLAFLPNTSAADLLPIARKDIRIGYSLDTRCNLDLDAIQIGTTMVDRGLGSWDSGCEQHVAQLTKEMLP
jgi:hypothetical protein